ncbi:Pre-mRNA-splicing factor SLU7-A [Olea europaea subsp. europaea]|uniref:Pre-mRNA-splicing factor SLU7 n=1 Tax=Olea europaea subsp. europaea TaxID=158383 RepID=A0A8S0UUH5_OLEEU|nr:Pre-mRNA-splicing factor SLU7-A [Olea europaea subsp. europaea]
MDFAKVEKRVRTTGSGSTGTVRNLRIEEDTAKYLLNLDVNSIHYDPKTHSMHEDPLPDMNPNEKFYAGDNCNRVSGQALEFKQLNIHAWEAFDKGHDVHMQAAPSQAKLLYKNFEINKEKLKSQTKETIMEKYGNAATDETLPRELLLGQSEREVEYDRAGRIIKGHWGFIYFGDIPPKEQLTKRSLEEDDKRREEKDERKRKYSVKWKNEITPKDMEAYQMKRVHHDDPMKDFIHLSLEIDFVGFINGLIIILRQY